MNSTGYPCHTLCALCHQIHHHVRARLLQVDFSSIPQENSASQMAAISSIAAYTACCRFFIVIAPTAVHADSGVVCDAATYAERGWVHANCARYASHPLPCA